MRSYQATVVSELRYEYALNSDPETGGFANARRSGFLGWNPHKMSARAGRKIRFTSLDIFCGCGGLSLGLRRAGFNVLAAIDSDELSVDTYRHEPQAYAVNQPGYPNRQRSIDLDEATEAPIRRFGSLGRMSSMPGILEASDL